MTRKEKDLVRQGIAILEEEREIIQTSYQQTDGVVRDKDARAELRKFDRWLKKAKAAVA